MPQIGPFILIFSNGKNYAQQKSRRNKLDQTIVMDNPPKHVNVICSMWVYLINWLLILSKCKHEINENKLF